MVTGTNVHYDERHIRQALPMKHGFKVGSTLKIQGKKKVADKADRGAESSRKKTGVTGPLTVLTIGHSTRTIGEFIQLLQAHGVTRLVDVRTVPRSRHNPQFNRDTLPTSLKAVRISYKHMTALGGFRHTVPDSPNLGWNNVSFRGFADYMQTPEFTRGLDALIELAEKKRSALMCAEAVPWRCHRSLIADALLVRGIMVEDIMSLGRCQIHKLTSFAKISGRRITYPPAETAQKSKHRQESTTPRKQLIV